MDRCQIAVKSGYHSLVAAAPYSGMETRTAMTPQTDRRASSGPPSAISAQAVWQGAAIAALILVIAAGLFLTIWLVAYPLALLFAAIVLSNALAPLVRLFERIVPFVWAVALTYLSLVVSIVGIGWLVIPRLLAQARELTLVMPTLLGQLQAWLDGLVPGLAQRSTEALEPILQEAGAEILRVPIALVGFAIGSTLVLIMSVYWTVGSDDLRRYIMSIVPRHLRDEAAEVAAEMVDTIGGYLQARVVAGGVVGLVVLVGLWLTGAEYPLVLAVLAAIGELIPYLGPTLAAAPAVAFALTDSPGQAALVLVLYVAVQQAKELLLMPTLVRHHANIPPLLVVLSLIAGTAVGGVIGGIVAPPLIGALRVVVVRILTPPMRHWADHTTLGAPSSELDIALNGTSERSEREDASPVSPTTDRQ